MNAAEKIFRAFYETRERKLYFNQLKERTRLSNSSLQNALAELVKNGILQREETKANTFYSIRNGHIAALRFAEQDLERFDTLHTTVRIPLSDLLRRLPPQIVSVVLFGSAARKTERSASDIDLVIILHTHQNPKLQEMYEHETVKRCEEAKKEAEAAAIHPFSLAFTTLEEYRRSDDHLLAQARISGFPLINQQRYHEVMDDGP